MHIPLRPLKLLSLAASFLLASAAATRAADILGCPKGIAKGTIWPRLTLQAVSMDDKWDAASEDMIGIDQGPGMTEKDVLTTTFRLGYGLTDHIDIATVLKHGRVESEKRKRNGSIGSFDAEAPTEFWLAAKYIFLDVANEESTLSYLKLSVGAAYGLGLVDDAEDLVAGLGPGCDKAQVAFLTHGGLWNDSIEFAGHLIYEWRGKAPDETDAVSGFTFSRAGEDIPDQLQYMAIVEKPLCPYATLKAGFSGWIGMQKDPLLLDADSNSLRPYSHGVMTGIELYPMTDDYEKRKVVFQVSHPYSVRNSTSSDLVLSMIAMWTF